VIGSFRHKGLKELFETGRTAKIGPAFVRRALVRLDALEAATAVSQLAQPGFDFHTLRGTPRRYTIHVNGPWCITFEWRDGNAYDVDFEQYH
jgi:proteic killer suppression protein